MVVASSLILLEAKIAAAMHTQYAPTTSRNLNIIGEYALIHRNMKLIIAKVMFTIRLQSGVIVPSTDPDGKVLYAIPQDSIEYAYKKEIIQYFRTGEFKYDDTLDDKVDTASFK